MIVMQSWAIFYLACKPNPYTFVKIPSAKRAKGYSNEESKDKMLLMQVCLEVAKIKGGGPPPPS